MYPNHIISFIKYNNIDYMKSFSNQYRGDFMKTCSNFVFLSMLACDFAETLSADELAILSEYLTVFADMLSTIATEKEICNNS